MIFMIKEDYIYVGIDLHKETHTAVIIDCYNNKLGEITFANRSADFTKLANKVKNSQQALICMSRRLISIIYGMLKNGTEYRIPVMENTGE